MFTSLPQTFGKDGSLRPLLVTARPVLCLFVLPYLTLQPPPLLCPAATPGTSGISGERPQPAQKKIALHLKVAERSNQQVAETVHPEAKHSLLTAFRQLSTPNSVVELCTCPAATQARKTKKITLI